ncbi:hypothetical protein JHK84_027930 [Glycine max]|nr:hypothetical protein JHK86_027816 [Glycine max]KAG5151458.1 hypothetical protein JHK84_027930 [Glycine max]
MAYRSINQNVLANAPCLVGILVDKGLSGSNRLAGNQVSHNVAVMFFGGPDEREALCYGWRMVEHHKISLTVMRFVQSDQVQVEPLRHQHDGIDLDEPRVLTVQIVRNIQKQHHEKLIHEFRMRCGDDDAVDYVEKVVSNGEDTVAAIRTMDDIHDLFIVGRGQGVISPLTTGLTDWKCFLIYDIVPNGNLSRFLDVKEGDGEVLEWSTRVSIVKGIAKDPLEDEGSNYPQDLVLVPRGTDDDSVVVGSHIRGSRLRASAAGDEEVDLLLPGTTRLSQSPVKSDFSMLEVD